MYKGTLLDFQKEGVQFLLDKQRAICAYSLGAGKALADSELVLTPTSWRRNDELAVGDYAIGLDGIPTRIVGVFPQGEQDIVRVSFSDGASTRCTKDHFWTVRSKTSRWITLSVNDLLELGLIDYSGNYKWKIPIAKVEFCKDIPERYIVAIEDDGRESSRCIKVAREDGLYVIRDYVVTHNTHLTMSTVETLRQQDRAHSTMIVVPSYLKWKWADELETWTDTKFFIVDGSAAKRQKVYTSIYKEAPKDYYLIINYESLVRDRKLLSSINFDVVVLDEVSRIKNYRTKTFRAISFFRPPYRLGLTGTPIGNKAEELYAIMQWIDPKLFGRWSEFEYNYIVRGHFNEIAYYKNLRQLAQVASRRMIAKTQEEIADQLPQMRIIPIKVDFSSSQAKLYKLIAASLEEFLDIYVDDLLDEKYGKARITNSLARQRFSALRQACISPRMLAQSSSKYAQSLEIENLSNYVDIGPKILAVEDLLSQILANNANKAIVFCFFIKPLEYIEQYLRENNIRYVKLIGGMGAEEAYKLQQEFQTNPETRVFLTSDAGQKGIDLQQANYLINMDIPFSWENYDQRLGRFKRIGSPHEHIFVYDFMMKNSIEERFYSTLDAKGRLLRAALGKSDEDSLRPTDMSLRKYLKTRIIG